MVKTFQEWFAEQDWSKQMYLASNNDFINGYDKNGKKTHYQQDIVEYKAVIKCLPAHDKDTFFQSYDTSRKSWKPEIATQLLYASRLKSVNMISDSEYIAVIREGIDRFGCDEIQHYLTEKDFKFAMKQAAVYKYNAKLVSCIYCADDPEHPDWSLLVSEKEEENYFEYKWFRFIPFNEALKLVRKDLSIINHLMQFIREQEDKEVKDNYLKQVRELIFSKNGLSLMDRNKILIHLYKDRSIHDFIREILPIDIRYGKLIPDIYKAKRYTGKAITEEMNGIINLRKRDSGTQEERDQENWYESTESSKPRYSKKVRQMAMIYRACLDKSYPKTKATLIGDALCLLKMYDFNWNQVFDAVYGHSDI